MWPVNRILNLDDGFEKPDVQKEIVDQFQAAAKANTDAGVEVATAAGPIKASGVSMD
jgi:hypothetical protein